MTTRVVAGVLPLRRLEGGHAVGDGLDAGHGRATRGEGVQQQERCRRCAGGLERRPGLPGRHDVRQAAAEDRLVDARRRSSGTCETMKR